MKALAFFHAIALVIVSTACAVLSTRGRSATTKASQWPLIFLQVVEHGVVDGRAVTPAGGCDQIADRELLGIEQRDRAQAAVLAGGGDAADDVGCPAISESSIIAEAGRQAAGELRVVLQAGDDDRALGEVIVHSVVGALDVVAGVVIGFGDGQGVEDDLVAGELGAAAGEGEGLGSRPPPCGACPRRGRAH